MLRVCKGHINKTGFTLSKQLNVEFLATKNAWEGALHIMVVEKTFLNYHNFDQADLLAVTCDSNNYQIILSYAIITSKTEDNWV